MEDKLEMIAIGDRKIVVRGMGKMFYQDGMPISIMAGELRKKGLEVSWLHVADELLKHGWSSETTFKKLREEMADGAIEKVDIDRVEKFCDAFRTGDKWEEGYYAQREMIFQYLFAVPSSDPGNTTNPDIVNFVTGVMTPDL